MDAYGIIGLVIFVVLDLVFFSWYYYLRYRKYRKRDDLTPAPDYIVPPIPMPWHKEWHDAEAARRASPRAGSDGISSVAQAPAPYPAAPNPTNSPYPTGTPYPHPSYQPAMLHPEGAGYPQGFAPAAGNRPPGASAAPHPTYPSAPYPTYPSAPYPTYPSAPYPTYPSATYPTYPSAPYPTYPPAPSVPDANDFLAYYKRFGSGLCEASSSQPVRVALESLPYRVRA